MNIFWGITGSRACAVEYYLSVLVDRAGNGVGVKRDVRYSLPVDGRYWKGT